MTYQPPASRSSSWFGDKLLPQLVALSAFVLFPAFVTAVAPITWVTFTRSGAVVSAQTEQCVFFVVPYLTRVVSPVTGVKTSFTPGVMVPNSFGQTIDERRREHRTEDEADLHISGPDQQASVMVAPVDIEQVHARVSAFLADPQAASLQLYAVANWKASVYAGAPLTLLTVFYAVCVALTLFKTTFRLMVPARA